ncbi:MAG: cytidine deaminase [Bowdeniella nasicola]|nr:cytidine deaminase [Bowdeniella nasicola]
MAPECAPYRWSQLREAAAAAAMRAYAPYSHYRVGAAAATCNGRILTGCNVENAAYGVALCAECGLISELVNSGGGHLCAFVCLNANGKVIMPCGRCRQLLAEHGAAHLTILTPTGEHNISAILPLAFSAADLDVKEDS